jgi:hypothetical protein
MKAAEREAKRLEFARSARGRDLAEIPVFRLLDRAADVEGFGQLAGECDRCGALLRPGEDAFCSFCGVRHG